MQTTTSRRSLAHTRRATADAARLQAIVDWEQHLRARRRDIRDDVREAAYDKAVDGLLKDDTLGRSACGAASAAKVRGLGERCLSWTRAEDLRARLTPDGDARHHPRAAASIDGLEHAELLAGREPGPDEIAHWRGQLRELCRRADAAGALTRDVVAAYLFGGDHDEVAERHGVSRGSVYQTKSRFVHRNPECCA